jgi:hypothetical protein
MRSDGRESQQLQCCQLMKTSGPTQHSLAMAPSNGGCIRFRLQALKSTVPSKVLLLYHMISLSLITFATMHLTGCPL